MAKFRLNRRSLIRGAGSIAIALPWLEIMGRSRKAYAAGPAKRFVAVFQPGGTVRANWTPGGTEAAPTYGTILRPLEPMKSKLLIVDGVEMKTGALNLGEQHQSGMLGVLTGTTQSSAYRQYASGPSIDQVIASRISKGIKPRSSIQFAVRWATGKSHGLLSPINALNFEDNATFNPIPPRLDPQEIWTDMFGTLTPTPGNPAAAAVLRKRSILDFVDKKYAALALRLGAADKAKLDQHLTKIREIESTLTVPTSSMTAACKVPTRVDTSDYRPQAGLMADDAGMVRDVSTDTAIPKVGKFMMDMLVMALACDITAVASLQWSDTEAKHTFPWLQLPNHHHYYQHDGGFNAPACEKICIWYSEQHLYLLQQMQSVDMGGTSLLDESVVFFGSELQEPPTHLKGNMPFMLAGNGGGMRTGRCVKYSGNPPHNNLLVSILNLFGDTRTTFGTPAYCTGALPNIV